jgi:hypothetical protein
MALLPDSHSLVTGLVSCTQLRDLATWTGLTLLEGLQGVSATEAFGPGWILPTFWSALVVFEPTLLTPILCLQQGVILAFSPLLVCSPSQK